MVAILKLAFLGTLVAVVAAHPVAAPQPEPTALSFNEQAQALAKAIAEADTYAKRDITSDVNDISARDLAKRGLVGPVFTLLGQVTTFLGTTIGSLLSLNLNTESSAVAKLLLNLNQFLLNIETSLKSYTPTSGLFGALQQLLIGTGLQSLVLGLTTIVSSLVSFLIGNGEIDASVKAQIVKLNATLTSLAAAFQAVGASSTGLTKLSTKLSSAINSS